MKLKFPLLFLLINAAYAQKNQFEKFEEINKVFDETLPQIEDNLAPNEVITELKLESIDPLPPPPILNGKTSIDIEFALKNEPFLRSPKLTKEFYETQKNPAFWDENLRQQLIELVKESADDALPPRRYHLEKLNNKITPELEIYLTDAYLTLMADLANGLVEPTKTQREWNAGKVSNEKMIEMLAIGVLDGEIRRQIHALNANNPRYIALKKRYQALQATNNSNSEKLPDVGLKLNKRHDAVRILRRKLGINDESDIYDEELVEKIKKIQEFSGLVVDGKIGKQTRLLLNSNKKQLLNQLSINMERQRWLPQELGVKNIIVNIPSYYVEMYDGENTKPIYRGRAVVGKKERPTPAFVDKLRHVVMSPTWTVPPTIFKKDKLPQLINNPAAFDAGYVAVAPNGKTISPSAVNWSTSKNYRLRQKPGKTNALGQVKFLFPNDHAIYLHDTPNKTLFGENNRAYSSGCIRIENPEKLANLLLKNTSWTSEKISAAMNASNEKWANNEPVPIYLVYWTAWGDLDGNLHIASDIYNKDAELLRQYEKAFN